MITKRLLLLAAAMLLALGLAACGGNGRHHPGNSAGASDAFFVRVKALIASSPENTEPIAIDSIAVTTPETIEPAAL